MGMVPAEYGPSPGNPERASLSGQWLGGNDPLIGSEERKDMVMSSVIWHPLVGVDEAGLSMARVQTHSAAQWLARAAFAYIPARPNDSHTNLGWNDLFGGFVTHALPDGARLGLRVTDLTLTVLQHAGAGTTNAAA
jgi:hypothetical protein